MAAVSPRLAMRRPRPWQTSSGTTTATSDRVGAETMTISRTVRMRQPPQPSISRMAAVSSSVANVDFAIFVHGAPASERCHCGIPRGPGRLAGASTLRGGREEDRAKSARGAGCDPLPERPGRFIAGEDAGSPRSCPAPPAAGGGASRCASGPGTGFSAQPWCPGPARLQPRGRAPGSVPGGTIPKDAVGFSPGRGSYLPLERVWQAMLLAQQRHRDLWAILGRSQTSDITS
jgi:hypothetical protein